MAARPAALDLDALLRAASPFGEARLVVVFGSVARTQARVDSDADVGILGVSFWRGLLLGEALGSVLGREAHVVELERASDWLRYEVARDGVLVHETPPGEWARFRAEAALRYFDLRPIIELCAAGATRALRHPADG